MKKINSIFQNAKFAIIIISTTIFTYSFSSDRPHDIGNGDMKNIMDCNLNKQINNAQMSNSDKNMISPDSGKSILKVSITDQISCKSLSNEQYLITMPLGTDFNSIVPVFLLSSGAAITPESVKPVNFVEGPLQYKVTAANGTTRDYSIMASLPLILSDNINIKYTGRIDFTTVTAPKFSAPGVYFRAKFKGTFCDIEMTDETNYNYIEVVIDNQDPVRVFMKQGRNVYRVAANLPKGEHTILICKDTEACIGSLIFHGFRCEALSALTDMPIRKIECYGNSITCGAKMIKELCSQGVGPNWNITNRAYMSFGAIAARSLNAEWMLTSVSGIGLIHNYGERGNTLPQVYDYLNLDKSSAKWDFKKYIPDVVTIELGTNDGVQDSATFCKAYIDFIQVIRSHYPNAHIFCLTSPSTDDKVFQFLKNCITGIVEYMNKTVIPKDDKVYKLILSSHGLNGGCDGHPTAEQHLLIADELKTEIKAKLGW
jgi:lysophospholipase L1-like esterase